MSTQVVRVEKFTKGSLQNIGNELERTPGIDLRNPDIDSSLTHLNPDMHKPDDAPNWFTRFSNILEATGARFNNKKGVCAFEGMIITSDTAFLRGLAGSAENLRRRLWSSFLRMLTNGRSTRSVTREQMSTFSGQRCITMRKRRTCRSTMFQSSRVSRSKCTKKTRTVKSRGMRTAAPFRLLCYNRSWTVHKKEMRDRRRSGRIKLPHKI